MSPAAAGDSLRIIGSGRNRREVWDAVPIGASPIALGRLCYDGTRATYRGRRVHPVSGEDCITLDPLQMLA